MFGCQVMVHVPKKKRKKLDRRSKEGILLRCLPHLYRVWIIETQTVEYVRHVAINEAVFPARKWQNAKEYAVNHLQVAGSNVTHDGESGGDKKGSGEADYGYSDMPELIEEESDDEIDDDDESTEEEDSQLQTDGEQLTYIPGNEVGPPVDNRRYPSRERRVPIRLAFTAQSEAAPHLQRSMSVLVMSQPWKKLSRDLMLRNGRRLLNLNLMHLRIIRLGRLKIAVICRQG